MPEVRLRDLRPVLERDGEAAHPLLLDQAEHDCKYAGYIRLQNQDLERLARRKALTIPPGFDFDSIPSLSREMRDRLRRHRPASLLEAESIPGFTPAALTALYLSLEVFHHAPGGAGTPPEEEPGMKSARRPDSAERLNMANEPAGQHPRPLRGLLYHWNRRMRLVGERDAAEFRRNHLAEVCAVLPDLAGARLGPGGRHRLGQRPGRRAPGRRVSPSAG